MSRMKKEDYIKFIEKHFHEFAEQIRQKGKAIMDLEQIRKEGLFTVWPQSTRLGLDKVSRKYGWKCYWSPTTKGIPDELPPSLRDYGNVVWSPIRLNVLFFEEAIYLTLAF